MKSLANIFPENMKKIRKNRKMSQEDLAHSTGIDQGQISRYETGKRFPEPANIQAIKEALKCTFGELFGDEPKEQSKSATALAQINEELEAESNLYKKKLEALSYILDVDLVIQNLERFRFPEVQKALNTDILNMTEAQQIQFYTEHFGGSEDEKDDIVDTYKKDILDSLNKTS